MSTCVIPRRKKQESLHGLARAKMMKTKSLQQRLASSLPIALLQLFAVIVLVGASIFGYQPAAHSDPDLTAQFQKEIEIHFVDVGVPNGRFGTTRKRCVGSRETQPIRKNV
jgi:hypothetical protein